ncbi:MAG: YraN family protein [Iodobacter sp.]
MNLLGVAAENAAVVFLQKQGLKILARNWQCPRGEIDILAKDGNTLVFVEVRQRRNPRFGGAAASISRAKRAKLLATAQYYLINVSPLPPCRFDAICFEGEKINWLKNCIDATEG